MEKRILYFDIAKFIAMMMVILGHFGVPDINRFVFSFHIPLFFLVSGYFFKQQNNLFTLAKIKFRHLIIPYLFVMLAVIIIFILVSIYQNKNFSFILDGVFKYFIGYIYGSGYIDNVLGYTIEIVGPIWFCLALYFDFIFLQIALKTKFPLLFVICIFLLGYCSSNFIWLPFSLQSSMTALLFFYLGYIARQYSIFQRKISISQIFPLLGIWAIGLNYESQFLIVENASKNPVCDILVAIVASYIVVLYCKWWENESHSAKIMAFLGKYTIVMLCLHSIDVNIMPWNDYFKTPNTETSVIILKLLITLLKFLFPILGALIVSKSPKLKRFFNLKY